MPIIVPSRLAILLMALGVPLGLLIAAIFPQAWTFSFDGIAGLGAAIALDALMTRSSRRLSVEVDCPTILFVGPNNEAQLRIQAENDEALPSHMLAKLDLGARLDAIPPAEVPTSGELTFQLQARQRGLTEIDAVWLRWRGPMGLCWKQVRKSQELERAINPDIRTMQADAIRLINREAEFGMKTQRDRGDGSEFDALREFVTGMDRRSLDWKASARHRTLMAKEYQTERNHNVVLAFDTGRLMCEPINGMTRLDHAVHAGMLLAYASLRGGDRVGVYGFDARPQIMTGLVRGQSGFGKLQSELAKLEYSTFDANYTLGLTRLSAGLNRRSLIILFTDFVDTIQAELMVENAARLAKRHLVVFAVFQDEDLNRIITREPETADDVTRAVIAEGLLQERRMVQKRLQRLGVEVLEAPAESFSSDLLSRYLQLTREERI